MNTVALIIIITLFVLLLVSMNKLGKTWTIKQKIAYKNVNNNWINPQIWPEDGDRKFVHVIVTIRNKDGKIYVQDSIFDTTRKRFTGLTPQFHNKVIAWMPYPEPYSK
jgi:major membrane immunogen (membrane-anchored lipoprotein)